MDDEALLRRAIELARSRSASGVNGPFGAIVARGLEAGDALLAGVYLHGLAGDLAAERAGEVVVDAPKGVEEDRWIPVFMYASLS